MKTTKVSTDIVQWAVRNAFEEGYRAAVGDRGVSIINAEKGKWFDAWARSKSREMLVLNGIIDEEVTYK